MFGKRIKPGKRTRTHVHLGNLDTVDFYEGFASKTKKYAKRFKNVDFIGIDLEELPRDFQRPENWRRQIKANFVKGLKKLGNNSIDYISSEMALGHCNAIGMSGSDGQRRHKGITAHTTKTLQTAYRKLRKGAKISFVVDVSELESVKQALEKTPFKQENITIRKLRPAEQQRTYWIWAYHGEKYRITAIK